MTDRRGDEGFSVAPQRIGGESGSGRGPLRGRPLKAILVLVACLSVIGVAGLGPRLSGKPNFDIAFFATPVPSATPTPSETPRSVFFGPTPLPEITRNDGGSLSGRVAIWADGLRVLDLGGGTVGGVVYTDFSRDVVIRAPDGNGWWCVCMQDSGGDEATGVTREVQLLRIAADGTASAPRTITTLGDAKDPAANRAIQTDIDLGPDGLSGLVTVGRQTTTSWEYSVARIDLVQATIGPWTAVGRQMAPPAPEPSATPNPDNPGTYVNAAGPYIRLSPDGSQAVIWSQIQQVSNDTITFTENLGWRIPVDAAGNPGEPLAAAAFARFPDWCPFTAFVRDDRLVATCLVFPVEGSSGQPALRLFDIGSDGEVTRQLDLPQPEGFFAEPLLDTANGVMWLWDASNLTLTRVDTTDLTITSTTFDPLVERTPGVAAFRDAPRVWDRPGSAVRMFGPRLMTGSLDGRRLYLLGYDRQPRQGRDAPGSLGVLVVDPSSLELVDRWAPAAYYSSVESVLDGKVVAVGGQGGMDADGRSAPWVGSMTLHDAQDGRILMRFGQVGEGFPPMVIAP
jgi:hypothetical protein